MSDTTDGPRLVARAGRSTPAREGYDLPIGATGPSGAMVLTAVLDQFAHNFMLNDLGVELSSGRQGRPTYGEHLAIGGPEPHRRESSMERVHQARVSVRRLRSTIRTFENLFDPHWSGALTSELAWYGAVLGAGRDLDVLRGSISQSLWLVDDPSLRVLLLSFLDQTTEEIARLAAQERSSVRYQRVVQEIGSLASRIQFRPEANGPAVDVLQSHLRATWRHVREGYRDAQHHTTNRRLHRLRIELKRLQYASEIVGVVEGKPAIRLAHAAEALQTKLGSVHDASLCVEWLVELVGVEPRLRGPLGDVIEFHETGGTDARRGWRDAMKRVERCWRRWKDERVDH